MKKELRFYRTKDGKEPFAEWLSSLKGSWLSFIHTAELNFYDS
jgi:hypothetical protein